MKIIRIKSLSNKALGDWAATCFKYRADEVKRELARREKLHGKPLRAAA